jgi:xanthine dehydrogenase YagR molybdenum-binding subunit
MPIIGQPLPRVEGPLKVTGRAPYAAEYRASADHAHGVIVPAAIGMGRVARIETSAAEEAPGVLLVMTHRNAPAQAPFGPPTVDDRFARPKPQLGSARVRHHGEPIAFVVAETLEEARAAAHLVSVEYAAEPGAFDMEAGRESAHAPKDVVAGLEADSAVGDFAAAFAEAPVQVDATYHSPYQHHNALEPQATLAEWDGDRLTVHCATQMVDSARTSLAATLDVPVERVRVVSRYVGGGFGNKLPIYADTVLAALAARELGRPVRVALTHRQMFDLTTHRPLAVQRVRVGAGPDGRLTAMAHEVWTQSARFDEFAEPAAVCTRSLYAAPHRITRHRVVPLDLPVAGAMRAPGEAVGLLAVEAAMDELAERLGLDPVELRIRNEPREDPERKVPFSTRALVRCLQEGAQRFGWERRTPQPGQVRDRGWLIGVGMAAAIRPNYLQESRAAVRLFPDGTAVARLDMTDIGTGSYTILAQIAAETLGIPVSQVRVELGDSDFPTTPGSGGSYGAASSGSALHDACRKLRRRLGDGRPLAALAQLPPEGLEAAGHVQPGKEYERFSQHSYGAHFAEVAVDPDTGEIRLRRMLGVFAAGRILNARTARSQLIGGMIWGVGTALHEETWLDLRDGSFVNRDLAGYHVPTHADAPDVEAILLPEFDDKANPLGAKGVGELGICGAGAAVANAVYNACGVRVRAYPITLDKLLAGLPEPEGD